MFLSSKSNYHSNPNRIKSGIGLNKSGIIKKNLKYFISEGFV